MTDELTAQQLTWIPIKDQLPAYGERVLLVFPNDWCVGHRRSTDAKGDHWQRENISAIGAVGSIQVGGGPSEQPTCWAWVVLP